MTIPSSYEIDYPISLESTTITTKIKIEYIKSPPSSNEDIIKISFLLYENSTSICPEEYIGVISLNELQQKNSIFTYIKSTEKLYDLIKFSIANKTIQLYYINNSNNLIVLDNKIKEKKIKLVWDLKFGYCTHDKLNLFFKNDKYYYYSKIKFLYENYMKYNREIQNLCIENYTLKNDYDNLNKVNDKLRNDLEAIGNDFIANNTELNKMNQEVDSLKKEDNIIENEIDNTINKNKSYVNKIKNLIQNKVTDGQFNQNTLKNLNIQINQYREFYTHSKEKKKKKRKKNKNNSKSNKDSNTNKDDNSNVGDDKDDCKSEIAFKDEDNSNKIIINNESMDKDNCFCKVINTDNEINICKDKDK